MAQGATGAFGAMGGMQALEALKAALLKRQQMEQAIQQQSFENQMATRGADRADRQLDATVENNRLNRESIDFQRQSAAEDRDLTRALAAREMLPPDTFIAEGDPLLASFGQAGIRGTLRQATVGAMGPDFQGPMPTGETPEQAQAGVRGYLTLPTSKQAMVKADDDRLAADQEARKVEEARRAAASEETARHNRVMESRPVGVASVVVQGPEGPMVVDKREGVARPVNDASGRQVGPAPTQQQRNQSRQFQTASPVLDSISELSERINTLKGLEAKAVGEVEKQKARVNLNDDVAEYEALISGFTPLIARALGHTGVLTQQDVDSVRAIFPSPGDSKSLRDRKIARIKGLMGDIEGSLNPAQGGQAPAQTGAAPAAAPAKPTAAELIKKYGGGGGAAR